MANRNIISLNGSDRSSGIVPVEILYTKNAAEICGFAGLGQLKPGYSADFAVISEDIFCIDPHRIDEVCVKEIYICGEKVYG